MRGFFALLYPGGPHPCPIMVMAMLIAEADTPTLMESIAEVLPCWKLMVYRIQQTAPPLSRLSGFSRTSDGHAPVFVPERFHGGPWSDV